MKKFQTPDLIPERISIPLQYNTNIGTNCANYRKIMAPIENSAFELFKKHNTKVVTYYHNIPLDKINETR
ncbi:MAG: hypothetical protein LBS60_02325 [Deltaproteobacteria bacterium]|jgi:hypothetical protein|nr:hypothetical protein [Deltaproteobacteria bacterium]